MIFDLTILVRGNRTIQRLHSRIRQRCRFLSGNPFRRYSKRRFRQEFFQLQTFCSIFHIPTVMYGIKIPQKAVHNILEIKNIENEVIISYSNLVRRIANLKRADAKESSYIELNDLEAEGYFGLLDAIYGYRNLSVKFITYAHRVIGNRINAAIQRTHTNFPWPRSMRLLYKSYEQHIAKHPTATLDEVLIGLDIDEKQYKQLCASLLQVTTESNLHTLQGELRNKREDGDYTSFSVKVANFRPPVLLDPDQRQAIEGANLNEWEWAVLNSYLSGHKGWRTDVAKQFGKSRMAPTVAMEIIKRKVLAQMEKVA